MMLLLQGFLFLMTTVVLQGFENLSQGTEMPESNTGSLFTNGPENTTGSLLTKGTEHTTGSLFTNMPENTTGSLLTNMPENTTGSLLTEMPENTTGSLLTNMPENTTGSLFTEIPENTNGSFFHENPTFDGNASLSDSDRDLHDEDALNNYDDYQCYDEYYDDSGIEEWFGENSRWITGGPGVIFNSITIIVVVSRMKPFKSINSLFILILSFTDLINVTLRIVDFLTFTFDIVTDMICKIVHYLYFFSLTYSNIIVVCWSLERFIAVWFPLKYRQNSSLKTTAVVLGITGIVMSLLAIPYAIEGYSEDGHCILSNFLRGIWTPVEAIYYIWIPGLVISVSNALIVYKLIKNRKGALSKAMSTERAEQRAREQRQMTIVLMSVSLMFLTLHLPQAVTTVYMAIPEEEDDMMESYLFWAYAVTEAQNSINFFLYCLTGREFRGYVVQMFCGCRKNNGPEIAAGPPKPTVAQIGKEDN